MNIDSIDELKKLAGLLNHNPVINTEIDQETDADCGCNDVSSNSETMRKYMDATNDVIIQDEEDLDWANSTEHFDGKQRDVGQPKGAVVDTSLRRHLNAKGDHVTVDENTVTEGFKDKLKVLALLGLTGFGLNYALDATSAKNSPLGKALYAASQQGDTEAGNYLKNMDALIDGDDTGTLQMLNDKYLHDENKGNLTTENMMESYKMYKDRTKERQKQRVKNKAKSTVRATAGGGNLKGMEAVEEANIHQDVISDRTSPLPNKKAYDIEKASETKKKATLVPEPWKNKKTPVKESIDLTQLKKNAGLL